MPDIFENKQEKVDQPTSEWRGPDLCADEVKAPKNGTLPQSKPAYPNSVRHVERPRRGYDYSY